MLYEEKMKLQREVDEVAIKSQAKKVNKPLKWHYLLSKYLMTVLGDSVPQGTI